MLTMCAIIGWNTLGEIMVNGQIAEGVGTKCT